MPAIVAASAANKRRPYIHKPHATPATTYGPEEICNAYDFPTGLAGGATIAIIELGGGRVPSNVETFCQKYGLPAPNITDVPCDASNSPGSDADGEVELDLQYACGSYSYCTGEPAQIRVYWATDFEPALTKIIADKKSGVNIVAISNSWGGPEDSIGAATCQQVDTLIAEAVSLGMMFFAAAGDNDSGDGEPGTHVDFPASSPHAIGCGGTSRPANGVETVWNDGPGEGTGGGYSSAFGLAPWQVGAPPPPATYLGRMVPDLALNADPQTGYQVYLASDGGWQVVGGTSAVAPIMAGLAAAINPPRGLAAYALMTLWGSKPCFTDITQGNNGMYAAQVGPDACTGLGTPKGDLFAKLFASTPESTNPKWRRSSSPPRPPRPQTEEIIGHKTDGKRYAGEPLKTADHDPRFPLKKKRAPKKPKKKRRSK